MKITKSMKKKITEEAVDKFWFDFGLKLDQRLRDINSRIADLEDLVKKRNIDEIVSRIDALKND